jgi:hypothetical protein
MSLLFPYRVLAVPHTVVPLGGRWSRPRPIVPISVMGSIATRAFEGRLDTGSDDTVFPESVAKQVGIDLTHAPIGRGSTANGAQLIVRYVQVRLRLTDGVERREWPAWIGFSSAIQRPLLGFAGFLQFFTAVFYGDREQVELTINCFYPGM